MVNQGEKINFNGYFEIQNGDAWEKITDLSTYTITALVVNESNDISYLFSSDSTDESKKITKDNTTGNYSFSISSVQSASMVGECTIEIALKNSTDNSPIITDNRGTFIIYDSPLGRRLAGGTGN